MLNILTPTLVGILVFVRRMRSDMFDVEFTYFAYATCFVGRVCSPLWSTWGPFLGEGKSGIKVWIVHTKVVRRACAAQTFPHKGGVGLPGSTCRFRHLVVFCGGVHPGCVCVCARAWTLKHPPWVHKWSFPEIGTKVTWVNLGLNREGNREHRTDRSYRPPSIVISLMKSVAMALQLCLARAPAAFGATFKELRGYVVPDPDCIIPPS